MRLHYSDYLLTILVCLFMSSSISLYGQTAIAWPAITGSWEVVSSEDRTGGTPLYGTTDFNGLHLHFLENNKLVWQNEKGYFVTAYQQNKGILSYDGVQLKIEYAGEDVLRFFYDEPISKRRVILILENSDELSSEAFTPIEEKWQIDSTSVHWISISKEAGDRDYQPNLDLPLAGMPTAPAEVYKVVDQLPRFPGCEDLAENEKKQCAQQELLKFIYKNIRYPAEARSQGIEGTAVVTFVVETDGSISNPRAVRNPGEGTGEEALRVVNLMTEQGVRWVPGVQRGVPVRVQFNLPIKFKL